MLQGALLGLTLSFLIGPLFFSIIQAGIERGFRAGLAVALGIWMSDFIYVIIIQSGIRALLSKLALEENAQWLGWAGSLILIGFGIGTLVFQNRKLKAAQSPPLRSIYSYAFRGFMINTVNPFTVFFWIGTAATIATYPPRQVWLFFSGMFAVLIIADVSKAKAAHWLRDHLSPRFIRIVQYCIGVFLIISGVVLALRV